MPETELVPVASLFVRCSLKVRALNRPGYALSDSCGAPADYAVEMPSGARLYRCTEHRDVRWVEADSQYASVYAGEDRIGPTYTMVYKSSS